MASRPQTGFMMGLDYATGGTMTVAGKKLVVIEKDDQGKPDVGKSLLAAAYGDDKADIAVGPTVVGRGAGACCRWPRNTRRSCWSSRRWPTRSPATSGTTTSSAPAATARRTRSPTRWRWTRPASRIATLAQDYAFGRDGVKAFKDALKNAKIVHEEYLPTNTTDFTAGAQRLFDALKDQPGRKVIWIIWAGAGNPFKIADLDLKRYGIEIATGGNILPAMAAYKHFPGMEGATYYYFGIPKNPVNEWLVANHYKQFKSAARLLHRRRHGGGDRGGRGAEEDRRRHRHREADRAMEGMSFETPKGKMTFRKEDHQAMQAMYHFKIKVDPAFAWGVPELVREIKPEEMEVPIRNKR